MEICLSVLTIIIYLLNIEKLFFHSLQLTDFFIIYIQKDEIELGLGLGLQGLYSATNCADNILGRFTIIRQIKLQE